MDLIGNWEISQRRHLSTPVPPTWPKPESERVIGFSKVPSHWPTDRPLKLAFDCPLYLPAAVIIATTGRRPSSSRSSRLIYVIEMRLWTMSTTQKLLADQSFFSSLLRPAASYSMELKPPLTRRMWWQTAKDCLVWTGRCNCLQVDNQDKGRLRFGLGCSRAQTE